MSHIMPDRVVFDPDLLFAALLVSLAPRPTVVTPETGVEYAIRLPFDDWLEGPSFLYVGFTRDRSAAEAQLRLEGVLVQRTAIGADWTEVVR